MRKNWFTIFFVICALLIIILADSGNLPRPIKDLYDFSYGDKVGHFLLMGLLSFFLNRTALASFSSHKPASVILTASLSLALFVSFEELSQQFLPTRTFSLTDLAVNYMGITFFAWVVWLSASKNKKDCQSL